jgi:Leucine-rich repeat (LRR) protein
MIQSQEYLNKNYPNKQIIKELDLTKQDLESSLTIENFPNLETIRCGSNKLTSIELINLPKLNCFNANGNKLTSLTVNNCLNITEFNIANNLLTDTIFLSNLNPEKLNCLSIHSNNFQEQDLSFLSEFINLERLFIDNNDKEKFKEKKYNRFIGSLQPLQNLRKLKYLNIANTDINSGLEYLPESFKKICLINS